jgi:hypothetical protein
MRRSLQTIVTRGDPAATLVAISAVPSVDASSTRTRAMF